MKKIKFMIMLLFTVISIISLAEEQQNNSFILIGQLKGLPDKTKVYLTTQEKDTVATAISNGDHFVFQGVLPRNGRFHFIKIDTLVSKINTKAILLMRGTVSITGELGNRNVLVGGSQSHNDYNEFHKLISKIKDRQDVLLVEINTVKKAISDKKVDSNSMEALKLKVDVLLNQNQTIQAEYKQTALKWIDRHNNSLYTPYVVIGFSSFFDVNETQNAYDKLTLQAKASYYGEKLRIDIETTKASLKIFEGATIPNFTITTLDQTKVFIHDIAAKSELTLIDCWASWCSPCRAEVPVLKKLYAEFSKMGFNIVGISSDKKESSWRMAVDEDASPWFQGIEGNEQELTRLFNINAIPAYILIDRHGKLIAFDCPSSKIKSFGGSLRGNDLYKKIDKLINIKVR